MFLSRKSSGIRLREAENARKNRLEILKALSHGQISRRDVIKWGLFSAGGMLAWKHGLNPFVNSAYADSNIPTGIPARSAVRTGVYAAHAAFRCSGAQSEPVPVSESGTDCGIQPDAAAPESALEGGDRRHRPHRGSPAGADLGAPGV